MNSNFIGTELMLGIFVVFLAAVNIVFLAMIFYFRHRSTRCSHDLQKELDEVFEVIQNGFEALKEELEDSALDEKEKEARKFLRDEIKRIEESVKKETSDLNKYL